MIQLKEEEERIKENEKKKQKNEKKKKQKKKNYYCAIQKCLSCWSCFTVDVNVPKSVSEKQR